MSVSPPSVRTLQSLPPSATDQFGTGTKTSQFTIDLGLSGSGVIVAVAPGGATPLGVLEVLDSPSGGGFSLCIDPNAVQVVSSSSPNKYLIASTQEFVTISMTVTSGSFYVTWAAVPGQQVGNAGDEPYYSVATTGTIPSNNTQTAFGLTMENLTAPGSDALVDVRQMLVTILNIGTARTATSAFLTFTDTSPSGRTVTINYTIPSVSLPSGGIGYFVVPLTAGYFRNLSVTVGGYGVAPIAGSIDVIVQGQGSGGSVVSLVPAISGSGATHAIVRDANATGTTVRGVPTTLYGVQVINGSGATAFVQMFDALKGAVTLGVTLPDKEIEVALGTSATLPLPLMGTAFLTALSVFSTTTEGGATTSAPGVEVFVDYA